MCKAINNYPTKYGDRKWLVNVAHRSEMPATENTRSVYSEKLVVSYLFLLKILKCLLGLKSHDVVTTDYRKNKKYLTKRKRLDRAFGVISGDIAALKDKDSHKDMRAKDLFFCSHYVSIKLCAR